MNDTVITGADKKMYTHFMVAMHSRTFVNQMNASVTMRQAGQSKKMAEARLSFEELSITVLTQFFPFLKFVHFFGTLCTFFADVLYTGLSCKQSLFFYEYKFGACGSLLEVLQCAVTICGCQ
jgi:hypothetical protein